MIWILFTFIIVFSGCQEHPEERRYKEIVIQAPVKLADPHAALDMDMSSMPMPSSTTEQIKGSLTWQTPSSWQESAGSGMRLVSFHAKDNPQSIDCSIVSLGGMAGGLEANLSRWMGQIGLTPSEEELEQLMNSNHTIQTQDHKEAKIYDFTVLQKGIATSTKSIIVGMLKVDESTVFIKMTGSIQAIQEYRNEFLDLVKSVKNK